MAKHARTETPLDKLDRLTAELHDDGAAHGQHRADTAYLEIIPRIPVVALLGRNGGGPSIFDPTV